MKVRAKKTVYFHDEDRKLVKVQKGQITDVPEEIVKHNPYAFEEVEAPPADGEEGGEKTTKKTTKKE